MLADTKPLSLRLIRMLGPQSELPRFACLELVASYGLGRHHNLRLLRSLKAPDFAKSAFTRRCSAR